MKVLIPTHLHDTQAIFVQLALERVGHEVKFLYPADLPTKQKISMSYSEEGLACKFRQEEAEYITGFDVVWWCKERRPFVPFYRTHSDDYPFVVKENQAFYEGLMHTIAPEAWWVNPQQAASRSRSKMLQLEMARLCGLKVPLTLCSNDPKDIRCFLIKHDRQGVYYKPLESAYSWIEDGSSFKIASPSKLVLEKLPMNAQLQLLPGLFQQEIKKKYEIKVICLGDYLVGAKLTSPAIENQSINWENLLDKDLSLEFYRLPIELLKKIKQMMRALGLVFCCVNFIVDSDDEYNFISLEEHPNFLWMEECNPDFRLLDAFVQFLLRRTRKYRWNPNRFEHCVDRYKRLIAEKMMQKKEQHLDLRSALLQRQFSQPPSLYPQ